MNEFAILDYALEDELLYLVSGGEQIYYLGNGGCSRYGYCLFVGDYSVDCSNCPLTYYLGW